MRLGEFGAAQHELEGEVDEFGFFGETFQVVGPIPPMLMLQLGAAATGKIDEDEGFAAIWEALRCSLTKPAVEALDGTPVSPADESQFNRLYKLGVEKGCDLDSLMRLTFTLFQAQSGRPTRPASDSSGGPSTTSPSSNSSATPAEPSPRRGLAEHPALAHLRSVDDLVRSGDLPALTG